MRLRAVLAELSGFVASRGNSKQKRMSMILKRVANDVCEEMGEADPATIAAYFDQMGKVVSWIGTGDSDSLPQQIRELFAGRAEGIQLAIEGTEELVAATSGVDTELSGADPRTG